VRTSGGLGQKICGVATIGVALAASGCGSDEERSANREVKDSLRAAGVRGLEIGSCVPQEDPEESEFNMYRCSIVAAGAVTLPGDNDRLPAGRSVYCFHVPRMPHGGGTEPIDADAYPAWVAEDGRCF
jgi:hypothetical protein